MSNPPSSSAPKPTEGNPKTLHLAGSVLFILGLLAMIVALFAPLRIDKMRMFLGAPILLAFGYPLMLHSKNLERLAAMEKRLADLEQRKS